MDSPWRGVLANEHLALSFRESAGGPLLAGVENRLSGRRVTFDQSHGFALAVDGVDAPVLQTGCRPDGTRGREGDVVAMLLFHHEGTGLSVRQEITLHGPVARLRLRVRHEGQAPVVLRDVTFLDARASEPARQGQTDVDLERGDAGEAVAGQSHGAFDANPLFLGDDIFLGVDWPVAQNACDGPAVLCRQFPGHELAPGQEWVSRTFSIGVAPAGRVATAFVAHLDALRGRPTRRAAFYFDWLLHASEGPTEAQTAAMLRFLGLLRERYGVQFDIYAVDDGAVETRWELMWDRYRLQHERLFPHGLAPLVAQARDLGMGFGVWLGPDVAYPGDPTGTRREEDIRRMVEDWNIHLIKLDTCVSWPLTADPYENDHYMGRLAALYESCRAINPDLVVINHRIRFSPYMLTVLDSTLWEGAESYPEVFLGNGHTPRLRTRYAAYARKAPTYYGTHSPLLEDHGMCFNGDWRGWREELVLGTFGRALALSPEIYGTLFLLPDDEYPELGRLMRLARENRDLLRHTTFLPDDGDFLHSDGTRALRCLVNDSWQTTSRTLRPASDFGLAGAAGYRVRVLYPQPPPGTADLVLAPGDQIIQPLLPFGVGLLEVSALDFDAMRSTPLAPPQARDLPVTEELARLRPLQESDAAAPEILSALELTRFAVDGDTPEVQALRGARRSAHAEVEACRAWYLEKQRHEVVGICSNAWDGDPATAWGDEFFWQHTSNVWRVDLGAVHPTGRVEITLSQRQPGPVRCGDAGARGFAEPVVMEVSPDLKHWQAARAHLYYVRTPSGAAYPHAFIAEFPAGTTARYLRIMNRGFWMQDLTVRDHAGMPLPRTGWRGNNTLTARPPLAVLSATVMLPRRVDGRTLAVVCHLGDGVTVDPNTEVALAWVRDGERVIPLVEASPLLPSHRWEHYAQVPGNNVVFRLPLGPAHAGRTVEIMVALFAPEHVRAGWITSYRPEARVYSVPETLDL